MDGVGDNQEYGQPVLVVPLYVPGNLPVVKANV
jgi:hypothetical protein